MNTSRAPVIWISSEDAQRCGTWAQTLRAAGMRVYQPDSGQTDIDPPDVILADNRDLLQQLRDRTTGDSGAAAVLVGLDGQADLVLDADSTERELVLACRLLAVIAKQRRELLAAASQGERMELAAHSDPLTGLPNRRAWDEQLHWRLESGRRTGGQLLAIIDLDQFKQVNDQFGHTVGDRALSEAAHAMQGQLRKGDFLARIGGDEFGLLLSGIDPVHAARVVDRIRAAVCVHLGEKMSNVTASAGYCVVTEQARSTALFEAADRALQVSKRSGRNRACGAEDGG